MQCWNVLTQRILKRKLGTLRALQGRSKGTLRSLQGHLKETQALGHLCTQGSWALEHTSTWGTESLEEHSGTRALYSNSFIPTVNKLTRVTRKPSTIVNYILTNSFVNTNFKTYLKLIFQTIFVFVFCNPGFLWLLIFS